MQGRIKKLETEVAQLQRVLREHGLLPDGKRVAAQKRGRAVSEYDRAREILRRAGLTREMTPEEKQLAAEWDARPEEEKRRVIEKLQTIRFDPPLSETIIQDRE